MNFVIKCSDGQYVNAPHWATKYSTFFKELAETIEDDFWDIKESEVKYEEPEKLDENGNEPNKKCAYYDSETGKTIKYKFVL